MDENNGIFDDSRLPVLLLVMGSASVLVTFYHCLSVCWGNRQAQQVPGQRPQGPEPNGPQSINYSSTVQLIPAHKYQKGMHMVGDDGVCAVCLGEFEEGEDLRTLPECLHSFHVPCIDMWLYSHPNCPVCRTDTKPLPQVLQISVPAR